MRLGQDAVKAGCRTLKIQNWMKFCVEALGRKLREAEVRLGRLEIRRWGLSTGGSWKRHQADGASGKRNYGDSRGGSRMPLMESPGALRITLMQCNALQCTVVSYGGKEVTWRGINFDLLYLIRGM